MEFKKTGSAKNSLDGARELSPGLFSVMRDSLSGSNSRRTSVTGDSTPTGRSTRAESFVPELKPIITSKRLERKGSGKSWKADNRSTGKRSWLRRGTKELGKNFQFQALFGALEGLEEDRLNTVQGSSQLVDFAGASSPKGSTPPSTQGDSHLQESFEAAKYQVDKDLVKCRQEFHKLLKAVSEPSARDFYQGLIGILGRCLGMDTEEFKSKVLSIVDELEDLRRTCQDNNLRGSATNLLFILAKCSRLAVPLSRASYVCPSYLQTSFSGKRIRRRLSGGLDTPQATKQLDDIESVPRSKSLPADRFYQELSEIQDLRSVTEPHQGDNISPASPHVSSTWQKGPGTKAWKGSKKGKGHGRRLKEIFKPKPSRFKQHEVNAAGVAVAQDDDIRTPEPVCLNEDMLYAGSSGASKKKGFLAGLGTKLRDSLSGKKPMQRRGVKSSKRNVRSSPDQLYSPRSTITDSSPKRELVFRRHSSSATMSGSPPPGIRRTVSRSSSAASETSAKSRSPPSAMDGSDGEAATDARDRGPRCSPDSDQRSPHTKQVSFGIADGPKPKTSTQTVAHKSPKPTILIEEVDAKDYSTPSPASNRSRDAAGGSARRRSWVPFRLGFGKDSPRSEGTPKTPGGSATRTWSSTPKRAAGPNTLSSDGEGPIIGVFALDMGGSRGGWPEATSGRTDSPPSCLSSIQGEGTGTQGELSTTYESPQETTSNLEFQGMSSQSHHCEGSGRLQYEVCRICENRVPCCILKDHSLECQKIEESDCNTELLSLLPSVDARLMRLANMLEAAPSGHDPDVLEIARVARSAAALQPDGTALPLERCKMCYDDLINMLKTGTYNRTMEIRVDALGRRIAHHVELKAKDLEHSLGTIDVDVAEQSSSTPTSGQISMSIEDFEIIDTVSRGAYGRVYLARKKSTSDLYAIKVMRKIDLVRKNMVESVKNERNILATTNNPFVVRFYYSFQSQTNLYIVMEYVAGGDCFSILRSISFLEEEVARVYIAETVLALEYCHAQGIIHRDLKPDNLLISKEGHIKLTDFGLSFQGLVDQASDLNTANPCIPQRMMSLDNSSYSETSDTGDAVPRRRPSLQLPQNLTAQEEKHRAIGTPDYMAPELLLGTGHTPALDWWSLGCILFQFVMGYPPFSAESPQKIFENVLDRKINWDGNDVYISDDCRDLVEKLLVLDPEQRLGARGATEIKLHRWFSNGSNPIDWHTLAQQKLESPFVPQLANDRDTTYFHSKPVSQQSMVHDLTWDSPRTEASGEFIASTSRAHDWPRPSILSRSESQRSSPGFQRQTEEGNAGGDSLKRFPSSVMDERSRSGSLHLCHSPCSPPEGSMRASNSLSSFARVAENDCIMAPEDPNYLQAPPLDDDANGAEAQHPSFENFSYRNLGNLAARNETIHDLLIRSGSIPDGSAAEGFTSVPDFGADPSSIARRTIVLLARRLCVPFDVQGFTSVPDFGSHLRPTLSTDTV
uniref:non-specific serine/threonine protein kinase n=1 Tax=Tetraselmis sp. GSL018 TaxID=582737 RepID=A0A061QQ55_9CHLO|eukprot:CAMPEP_0177613914 /NCGR_PEP_ID=MMETSP0419_2-20121207/22309_1 /TAXON_ID=582737 /ORGANISM="Tetraselmis sp., Strain GSL018" /LENGTH=1470 /DNA_ID=CAMNT_0019110803 /DNA_START=149 /DNA_END=4561 /DNA_ORIENTATION=+